MVIAKEKETQRDFAVKMLDKKHIIKEKKIEYVNTEKQCFNMINHPFFVRLYYTFQDAANLYFVLGLAPNGELLDFIKVRSRPRFLVSVTLSVRLART